MTLDKTTLIDAIIAANPTAPAAWLDRFDIQALRRYHDHLQHAAGPRGVGPGWRRDHETHAVVTRRPAA